MLSPLLVVAVLAAALQADADVLPKVTAGKLDAPLLLDALCDEPAWQTAPRITLAESIELRTLADSDFVYFCVTAKPVSYNTVDVFVAPGDGKLYNLHASAQVGERVHGADGWGEYTWWNHHGWYSPAVPFTGVVGEGSDKRADFLTGRAREIQLAKARFGTKPWRLMFDAGGTTDAAGKWTPKRWPEGADDADPTTWATFEP